jgi:hypothetical protein
MAVTAIVSAWVVLFGGLGRAWLAGCATGALSFVPLAVSLLAGGPGAVGKPKAVLHFGWDQAGRALKDAATLTTPAHVFSRYLGGHLGLLDEAGRTEALVFAVVTMALAALVGVALYWATLVRVVRRWREAGALDRLVPVLVLATGAAVFAMGLGTFIHYWIAAVPFVCLAIGRAFADRPRWLWAYVALSAAASFSFLWLVHERGGLPGAYGQSYRQVRALEVMP